LTWQRMKVAESARGESYRLKEKRRAGLFGPIRQGSDALTPASIDGKN
jgi:hypothetical protein